MTQPTTSEPSFVSHIYHISRSERAFTIVAVSYLAIFILFLFTCFPEWFADEVAIKKLSALLSSATILILAASWFFYKLIAEMGTKTVPLGEAPSQPLLATDLKKRWNNFSDNEICTILLSEQPTVYKTSLGGRVLKSSPVYSYGDIAMKLRRVLNEEPFFFDKKEILALEKRSNFFKPTTVDHTATIENESVLEKKIRAREKWPIYLTQLFILMLESCDPKERYSKKSLSKLTKEFCADNQIPDGNNYGLAISFVTSVWYESLPDRFKK